MAYRTQVIGGVVVRVPIKQDEPVERRKSVFCVILYLLFDVLYRIIVEIFGKGRHMYICTHNKKNVEYLPPKISSILIFCVEFGMYCDCVYTVAAVKKGRGRNTKGAHVSGGV